MSNKCTNFKGTGTSLKVQKELVSGETVVAPFFEFKRNSFNLDESINEIKSDTVENSRAQARFKNGRQDLNGEVSVPAEDGILGLFLEATLGKKTTEAEGNMFKHVYDVDHNCIPTLQFEETNFASGLNYRSTGVKVSSMDMEMDLEGQVDVKFGLMGQFKYAKKVPNNSTLLTIEEDAGINSKTIDVLDVSELKVGDTVILPKDVGVVDGDVEGRMIKVSNPENFAKNDSLKIGEEEVKVQAVTLDSIYVNRSIKLMNGQAVENVNAEHIIESLDTNLSTITFVNPLKTAVVQNQKAYVVNSKNELKTGTYFDNSRVEFTSNDESILSAYIEKMTFSYGNGLEKVKTLEDNRVIEGITESELTLDLILSRANAKMIEDAKNGVDINVHIKMVNENGSKFEIILSNCQVVPASPDLAIPALLKVQVKVKPSLIDGNYIRMILTNNKASI